VATSLRSARKPRKKSVRSPWYVNAFCIDYIERYKHRSDDAASAEVKFILSALKLPAGARVLDLCCGNGRHSRAFQKAGLAESGLDLSADLLCAARKKAAARGNPPLVYIQADMRRIPISASSMDAVLNLFTSFGYFSSERDNARVLEEVSRVLKPGATFVMDYLNLKPTLNGLVAESEKCIGTLRLREQRRYDSRSKRIIKRVEALNVKGGPIIRESVRAYSPAELKAMFKRASLNVSALYGDLNGSPFDAAKSPRCVLVAKKKSNSGKSS